MIGRLKGIIDSLSGSQMILDVQGVGYVLSCSAHTLRLLGGPGAAAAVWVEMQVREDAISLFGFAQEAERDMFRALTSVQGVGAKSGLSLLGILSPEKLAHAIVAQDKAALTAAEGVGPKLALRIVTELKDKMAQLALSPLALPQGGGKAGDSAGPVGGGSGAMEDAVSALVNLGYRRMDAFAAVTHARAALGEEGRIDALIRAALAQLSQKDHTA